MNIFTIYLEKIKKFLIDLEKNKKIKLSNNLNNLTKIQEAMIHCSFDTPMTIPLFKNLINNQDHSFSRYNFFLINYLLYKNDINSVKNIINNNKKYFESNIH